MTNFLFALQFAASVLISACRGQHCLLHWVKIVKSSQFGHCWKWSAHRCRIWTRNQFKLDFILLLSALRIIDSDSPGNWLQSSTNQYFINRRILDSDLMISRQFPSAHCSGWVSLISRLFTTCKQRRAGEESGTSSRARYFPQETVEIKYRAKRRVNITLRSHRCHLCWRCWWIHQRIC